MILRALRRWLAGPASPAPPSPTDTERQRRAEQRAGTLPWNYSRTSHARAAEELRAQLDYLVDVHGPDEVARRLRRIKPLT